MSDNETFLYLTTTGHISGQPHHIEIWYVEHDDKHYIVAETFERAHWVQNIRHNPQISFSVGTRADNGHALRGTGRVIDDGDDLAATVKRLMDDKYGWSNGLVVELVRE